MSKPQQSAEVKKPPNAGRGRKVGVPNKATKSAREGIAMLIEANVPKMSGWLTKIEQEHGPLVALKCVQDMLEYHVPKLQRTELTGDGGGALKVVINKLA
jgi:hypothetical protein